MLFLSELPRINIQNADYVVLILYMFGILACGMFFGRNTKSTSDFFFGGQRFSWWLIGMSCIATLIGSYSFINYSERGYMNGLSSAMNYTMDWFVLPLFLLIWLPIIYYTRVNSIPEYFKRRFDSKTRVAALVTILVYLIGYIGMNLYSIGVALRGMLGWNIYFCAVVVTIVCLLYMYHGGQTSVIMADLFQSSILIFAGILVFILGLKALGGFENFWNNLPLSHKLPFSGFNSPKEYHTVGIFWDDAITGTIAFYCMNQGILMRFMSARSVREGSKAVLIVLVILMPLAAIAVSSAGWIGQAMVNNGMLQPNFEARHIFVVVTNAVCVPGVFGFVMAALIAALLSTLDTYINAFSAIAVNDIWKPFIKKDQSDQYYLKIARYVVVSASLLGFLMIPFYDRFESVAQSFSHFCSTVTPPMIVVIVMGAIWKRFTPDAAFWTLVLGFIINVISLFFPAMITPFAHGESPADGHTYMRAFFGVFVSVLLGLIISAFTKPKPKEELAGLVASTVQDAMRQYKGGEPDEENAGRMVKHLTLEVTHGDSLVHISQAEMESLHAKEGDLVFVSDNRSWLGGWRSVHGRLGTPHSNNKVVSISQDLFDRGNFIKEKPVFIEKIM